MLKRVLFIALSYLLLSACTEERQVVDSSGSEADASIENNLIITEPVIVYSSRQEYLIKPLFERFTEETGIEVQYQTGEEGPLIARLQAEGEATFADILYTVDAGNLWSAANRGLLASVDSAVLQQNIPEHLREPQGQWFGLSVRARTIVYAKDRVDPGELSTYAALTDSKWRGRLCLRTSKEVYNISLVATMIERLGEEATQSIVEGWVENLAAPVFSSDILVIEAIAAGQCDVGLVNSYYLGRKQVDDPNYPVALFWANQETSGVHVNISGAGVTRYAKNPQGAQLLLEWLSTEEPQMMFSEMNLEIPANLSVPSAEQVAAWGGFIQDSINVEAAGRLQAQAVMLMDRADYR
ncbi:extracellular solute-binding protein [Haliea sp. AH-315-K21]|uniref:Fe(3+) ABC transporter substrate-binding protein n=1 Tax=SAR86 cluster bacterium TaxID=2030880 RepID=A0A2A5CIP0_9GAMM|nr:extracellular solute-binding protein [Haliea sp. AH-315-K21]MBN4075921.1 extracellular solute-binding protein [Gammaproteobacteria bacterium AH-315-E17]PCJ43652.1 MAG: Fe(3+) ABC transporter substrate-binding protein [SAR86 cluster bacterium]